VELMDEAGRVLAKARLPEGAVGLARLHAMIGAQLGEDAHEVEVLVGIETERGPWVAALVTAGYTVYAINPLQAARYRQRHAVSGAKSDAANAHTLADMIRTDAHQLRVVAADSPQAEAVKVVARVHKTLMWERTRHTQRLRHGLREYFPAALDAFDDPDAPDALELLRKAPDPVSAAKLNRSQIQAALKHSRRRDIDTKTTRIQSALRSEQLGRDQVITNAYAAATRSIVAVLGVLNEQVKILKGRSRSILAGTRTLKSSCPSPEWARSSAPGCWPNLVTPPDVTPIPRPARTTPAPARSPGRPERRRSCWPGSCTTTGSSTLLSRRPNPHCRPRPARASTTTNKKTVASTTSGRCGNSPTGWSHHKQDQDQQPAA
jgi:hypothetical protein